MNAMVPVIVAALRSITTPRFFKTERGYQGEFLAELRNRLPDAGLPGDPVVEQEYQKRRAAHGIHFRPDLIIHVPAGARENPRLNNFAVFELKLRAGPAKARQDFAKLDAVLQALDYPLGVFVNLASRRTQAAHYRGEFRDRIHFFAVGLADGVVEIRHAHYTERGLVEE